MKNKAHIVCGLAWGDEGKGAVTDYLCRTNPVDLVVRYNGGPQAAHNVVAPDGRHHTFAQFGSGTFVPGVRTFLSRFVLINPINMMAEEKHLASVGVDDAFNRLIVDSDCIIITPFQVAANRLLEISRGHNRHGSCGQGVGETRHDDLINHVSLTVRNLVYDEGTEKLRIIQAVNRSKILALKPFLPHTEQVVEELALLEDEQAIAWVLKRYEEWLDKPWQLDLWPQQATLYRDVVFEGAQGVLLDETHGDAPHNTWTDTTFNNAKTLLKEWNWQGEQTRIGVMRSYMTRHGAGPLPDEWQCKMPEAHNGTGVYQGEFRTAPWNIQVIERSLKICGNVDELAINHLDSFMPSPIYTDSEPWICDVEWTLHTPVTLVGYGPKASDKKMRVSNLVHDTVMA